MASSPDNYLHYSKNLVEDIFRKKDEYHNAQARLPIEQKIKILIQLQKISLTLHPKKDETDKRMVWQVFQ
jgi:hypothetical protein